MPKVIDTRNQRAAELLRMIEDGPAMHGHPSSREPYTPEDAKASYQLWMHSWIRRELIDLVPELRKMLKDVKYYRAARHDRRIRRGDDHAGDAWRAVKDGQLIWVAVGHNPNNPEVADDTPP